MALSKWVINVTTGSKDKGRDIDVIAGNKAAARNEAESWYRGKIGAKSSVQLFSTVVHPQ